MVAVWRPEQAGGLNFSVQETLSFIASLYIYFFYLSVSFQPNHSVLHRVDGPVNKLVEQFYISFNFGKMFILIPGLAQASLQWAFPHRKQRALTDFHPHSLTALNRAGIVHSFTAVVSCIYHQSRGKLLQQRYGDVYKSLI